MFKSITDKQSAYQEKLLLEKGWKPVYDDIHMRDPDYVYPILVGWVKEPSMQICSTGQAYKIETSWTLEMKINGEKV